MKTAKTKIAKYLMALFAVVSVATMSACDKKDGGASSPTDPYVIPGCTNCIGTGGLLGGPYYSANSAQTMWMTLDIIAFQQNGTTIYPYYGGGTNPVYTYNGTAALRGTIRISAQDYSTCYAPIGDYSINTVQAGQMSGGMLSGLRIDAVGPSGVHIVMDVSMSQVYKSSGNYMSPPDRMNIVAQFAINNYSCGTMNTY